MNAKKIICLLSVYAFFLSANAFAAETYQIVIFKELGKPCPACDMLKSNLALLKKNEGLDFTIKEENVSNIENFSANPEFRYATNVFPILTIVKHVDGKTPLIVGRRDADLFDTTVLNYQNLKTMIAASPLVAPKPPTTVPAPKPTITSVKPLPPTGAKPPSIPVPIDKLPNPVFTQKLDCQLKDGKYVCQFTDTDGKLKQITVDPAQDANAEALFDAIAERGKMGTELFRDPVTGAIRPKVVTRPSELPLTLPPVPGDPGYVPPPAPKANFATVTLVDGVYIATFPDGSRYKVTKGEYADYIRGAGGRDLLRPVNEIVNIIVASGIADGSKKPLSQDVNLPTNQPPVVTPKPAGVTIAPPAVAKRKYELTDPIFNSKTGMYEVKVSLCTEGGCAPLKNADGEPLILQVPKADAGDTEAAKAMIEKYLKDNGVPPAYLPPSGPKADGVPAPFRRTTPATVKPNTPAEVSVPGADDARLRMLDEENARLEKDLAASKKALAELNARLKELKPVQGATKK